MKRHNHIEYAPDVCGECGQTKTYILAIDRGTVNIVKKIARCIGDKGINAVHLSKECMAKGYLTHHEVGNISRPRFHGLVAKVKGETGNYLLTKKGAAFLRGEAIPQYAIISKAEHHQIGYFEEEKCKVTVHDFSSKGEYWQGIGYDVEEGRVIRVPENKQATLAL